MQENEKDLLRSKNMPKRIKELLGFQKEKPTPWKKTLMPKKFTMFASIDDETIHNTLKARSHPTIVELQ